MYKKLCWLAMFCFSFFLTAASAVTPPDFSSPYTSVGGCAFVDEARERNVIYANSDIAKREGCSLYLKNKSNDNWTPFENFSEMYKDKDGKEQVDYEDIYVLYEVDRANHIARVYAEYYDSLFWEEYAYILFDYETGKETNIEGESSWSASGNRIGSINFSKKNYPDKYKYLYIAKVVPGGVSIDKWDIKVDCLVSARWLDENSLIFIADGDVVRKCTYSDYYWSCYTLDRETAVNLGYIKSDAKKPSWCK